MLYNKKPLVQSVVEPTDTNVYWVQVIPNSTDVPIIKTFHNGAWTPITGTPASIQDLLDLKAPLHNPEFTGEATINGDPISTNNLNGTNYLLVYGTGTPTENAAELQAAYDEAKKMPRFIGFLDPTSPTYMYAGQTFGVYMGEGFTYYKILVDGEYTPYQMSGPVIVSESEAKSVRTTVIVAPGDYDFGATAFVVDTEGINIVSLTGNSDVIISSTEENSNWGYIYGIKVTNQFILIKGINCKTNAFYIADNLDNLICEYCIGGDYSFAAFGTASGTFNYCIGGNYSFCNTASGTFTNCEGGDGSFGGDNASGTFNNCIGGDTSFCGEASGTFTNCKGGSASFGSYSGTASGTFNYCIGDDGSFGSSGTASGIFNYCIGGNNSFGSHSGTASGTFSNCISGDYSFGTFGGIISGTFNHCTGGNNSFGSYGGTVSGTFNNCIGSNSFGANGGTITATARLYYTRLTSGTFPTPITGGRLILCIDGGNNIVTI